MGVGAAPAIENRSTEVIDSVATVDAESITEGGVNLVDERRPLLGRNTSTAILTTATTATTTKKSTVAKIKIKLSNNKKNKNIKIPKSVYQQQLTIL